MPLAPTVAAALTDPTIVRARALTIGGWDVLLSPGKTGLGVPIESIRVTNMGPGGVSSLSATIEDPLKEISYATGTAGFDSLIPGLPVILSNLTTGKTIFRGMLMTWSYRPREGGQGRYIDIEATGVEAWLDWAKMPAALMIPAGTDFSTAIQSVVAQSTGVPGLRASSAGPGGIGTGGTNANTTISNLANTTDPSFTLGTAVTITAGATLREALGRITAAVIQSITTVHGFSLTAVVRVTIDEDYGLRVYGSIVPPSDWSSLTANDSPTGTNTAANLNSRVDYSGVPHSVLVAGANAAGSGIVSDGTGFPGPIAFLSDSTIDSAAKLADAGLAYLAGVGAAVNGSMTIESFIPTSTIHVGMSVTLTSDTNVPTIGQFNSAFFGQLDRTFQGGGLETWGVTFGSTERAFTSEVRRLTRTTLS